VDLLRFLRPERKFGGLDEMKAAILRDAETARTAAEPYLQNQDAMI
jgi:riboflavin kinase/FMN adenylyltransferase